MKFKKPSRYSIYTHINGLAKYMFLLHFQAALPEVLFDIAIDNYFNYINLWILYFQMK